MSEIRSRAAVLNLIQASRAQLEVLLADVSDDRMTQDGVMEHWSLKDVLAHITWWEQWMLRVVRGEPEVLAELAKIRSDGVGRVTDKMTPPPTPRIGSAR